MTTEKLLENLYAIAYSLPEQERRFFCALEPAIDPNTHGEINAGHQLALLVRAIRTDMAQQYKRDDKRRTSAAALRRLYNASVSKQGWWIRPHFAGAFLDEQGRQYITDSFTLLRLNTPSTALQWAPPPNDPHVYDTMPELLNSDGATVTLNLPTAAEVRAKIASDKAKFKASSRPKYENFSTCFNWGDSLPMVNAIYLLNILEALPGCTAACRPDELSCVYFHSPDGDALIMPIRKYTAHNTDEQDEQEEHNV